MTDRVDFDFTANLRSLRAGLISVLPHAGDDDSLPMLERLRLFVTGAGVHVAACDRYTLAMAGVACRDTPSVLGCCDLDPAVVKLLLKVFRPANKDDDPWVRVEVTEKQLTVTDVSGLFPGTALTVVPLPAHAQWPDVPKILGSFWRARCATSQVSVTGEYLGRFAVAAKAYGDALLVEPVSSGRALVVSCGERFAGAVMLRELPDEAEELSVSARLGWLADLDQFAAVMPQVPEDKAESDDDVPADLASIAADLDGDDDRD